MAFVKLVTPKAGAKHELLFNKPALGAYPYIRKDCFQVKSKFITIIDVQNT